MYFNSWTTWRVAEDKPNMLPLVYQQLLPPVTFPGGTRGGTRWGIRGRSALLSFPCCCSTTVDTPSRTQVCQSRLFFLFLLLLIFCTVDCGVSNSIILLSEDIGEYFDINRQWSGRSRWSIFLLCFKKIGSIMVHPLWYNFTR